MFITPMQNGAALFSGPAPFLLIQVQFVNRHNYPNNTITTAFTLQVTLTLDQISHYLPISP